MTNEQLAILLDGIAARWHRAIGEAEAEADAASPRKMIKQHRHLFTTSCGAYLFGDCPPEKNPDHYEEALDVQPITQPLYWALDELNAQIASLRGEKVEA